MTNAHLSLLQWTLCDTPDDLVHPVDSVWDKHNSRLQKSHKAMFGHHVAYVEPGRALEDVTNFLVAPLTQEKRYNETVFASGPSGSGKSRIGWEAFRRVERLKA